MKQRKWFRRVVALVCVMVQVCVCTFTTVAVTEPEYDLAIFVGGDGASDENAGTSVSTSVATMKKAYELISSSTVGTDSAKKAVIVIVGEVLITESGENFNLPTSGKATYSHAGTITVTSVYDGTDYRTSGAVLKGADSNQRPYAQLGGPTIWENLKFQGTESRTIVYAGDNFTIGEGFETVLPNNTESLVICAGWCRVSEATTANITINSGTIGTILAATWGSSHGIVTDTVNIHLGGTAKVTQFYDGWERYANYAISNINVKVGGSAVLTRHNTGTATKLTVSNHKLILSENGQVGSHTEGTWATNRNLEVSNVQRESFTVPSGTWNQFTVTGNSTITMAETLDESIALVVDAGSQVTLAPDDNHDYTGEGTVIRPNDSSTSETAIVVYVGGEGASDENAGTSEAPVASMEKAYQLISVSEVAADSTKNAVIVIAGEVGITKSGEHFNVPNAGKATYSHVGTVTVTSVYGGVDYRDTAGAVLKGAMPADETVSSYGAIIQLGGPTVWENLKYQGTRYQTAISAGDHFTIGDGFESDLSSNWSQGLMVCAGWDKVTENTAANITINSGTVGTVLAMPERWGAGLVTGTVNINLGGTAIVSQYMDGWGRDNKSTISSINITVGGNAKIDRTYSTGGAYNQTITNHTLTLSENGQVGSCSEGTYSVTNRYLVVSNIENNSFTLPTGTWKQLTVTGNSTITMADKLNESIALVVDTGSRITLPEDDTHHENYQGGGAVLKPGDPLPLETVAVIYVGGTGASDSNDGASTSTPVATMERAYELVSGSEVRTDATKNAMIVIAGAVGITKSGENFNVPSSGKATYTHEGTITVTSVYGGTDYRTSGAVLNGADAAATIQLGGPTIWENLTFKGTANKTAVYAGDDFTIGEGFESTLLNNSTTSLMVCAGWDKVTENATANITINSGKIGTVMAMPERWNGGILTGTVNIHLGGTAKVTQLYDGWGKGSSYTIQNVNITVADDAVLTRHNTGGATAVTVTNHTLTLAGNGKVGSHTEAAGVTNRYLVVSNVQNDSFALPTGTWKKLTVNNQSTITLTEKLAADIELFVEEGSSLTLAGDDFHDFTGGGTVNHNLVFVSDGGSGNGFTPENPVGTLQAAYAQLLERTQIKTDETAVAKIVICGDTTVSESFNVDSSIKHKGTAIYTGEGYNAAFSLTASGEKQFLLPGPTKMEHLTIDRGAANEGALTIYVPEYLEMAETVTTSNTENATISVRGGSSIAASEKDVTIILNGGSYDFVAPSNELHETTGNYNIQVGGNASINNLVCGETAKNITTSDRPSAMVTINGNCTIDNMYLAGDTANTLSVIVKITGGTIGKLAERQEGTTGTIGKLQLQVSHADYKPSTMKAEDTSIITGTIYTFIGWDMNGDGKTNDVELAMLRAAFVGDGTIGMEFDCNGNGTVNTGDLARLKKLVDSALVEGDYDVPIGSILEKIPGYDYGGTYVQTYETGAEGTYTTSSTTIPVVTPEITDRMGGGQMLVFRDVTSEKSFNSYQVALRNAGFEHYASNKLDKNLFATYVNRTTETEVILSYLDNEDQLNILVEPLRTLPGLPEENVYTNKGIPNKVAMLTCGQTHNKDNGLCLIYQLCDGSFMIWDAGHGWSVRETHPDTWQNQAKEIYATLEKMAEQSGVNEIRIAAWFFTHPHGDHVGGFIPFAELYAGQVTVEKFIFNWPNYSTTQDMINYYPSEQVLTTYYDLVDKGIQQFEGAVVYEMHPGQTFYIRDAVVDVLMNWELQTEYSDNYVSIVEVNSSSSVCAIEIGGDRIMMMGDCSSSETEMFKRLYSAEFLKADGNQLAHHGYDGHRIGPLNEMIAAEYVLWTNDYFYEMAAEYELNFPTKPEYIYWYDRKITVIDLPHTGEVEYWQCVYNDFGFNK